MKIILGFKHVRFKCLVKCFSTTLDQTKFRSSKLADMLDCSSFTAREIVTKNKGIINMHSVDFDRNVSFCQKHLILSDIVEFPYVLTLNSGLLQHRYYSIKELGCNIVKASTILKYPQILKKSTKQLRKEGLIFSSQHLDYFNSFLTTTSLPEREDLNLRLCKLYKDGNPLQEIKEVMNAEALSWKLGSSIYKQHLMFKKCHLLRQQSIKITFDVVDILSQDYNLSINSILRYPNILSLNPENLRQLKMDFPSILGESLEQVVHRMPTILRKSSKSLKKILDILEEFKISGKQLMVCPRILSFCPKVLRERLEYINKVEDFSLLKSYKKFLWLIYYFNNIEPRLTALKSANIPCSISMFITSRTNFEKYLCFTECKTHLIGICHHLSETLGCTEKEAQVKLSEFPNQQSTCLLNCNRVVNHLLNSGVTKRQIFNGLGIVFYDFDVVKTSFEDLQHRPECQPYDEWIGHYNLVQLLVYVIEADNGFRGCRLYKEKVATEEETEFQESAAEC